MRISWPLLGVWMMVGGLGGCASAGGGESAVRSLEQFPEGTAWRLESSSWAGLEAGRETGIRMSFAEGRLMGDSGCNRFFTDARVVDGRLELGPIGASKRACIGPRMDSERALFDALGRLQGAYIDAGRLHLTVEGGGELVFVDDPVVDE